MKRFSKKAFAVVCAVVMSIVLIMSTSTMTTEAATMNGSETFSTRSFAVLIQEPFSINGNQGFTVTPEKGHQLFMQLKLRDHKVLVVVRHNGKNTYCGTFDPSSNTQTKVLISNCDGGSYTVILQTTEMNAGLASGVITLSQTQYQ